MKITLYSTHCPKCNILSKKLEEDGIEYTLCDDEDEMISRGFKSAPMLEVDGNVMNFKEAMNWLLS